MSQHHQEVSRRSLSYSHLSKPALLGKRHTAIYLFQKGFYHSHRISLILLHMFAKCLLALSISTSLGSQQAYCICIQLITAIVLHPHKTLLRPLPDLWLSLDAKFVRYMNRGFSLDSDPAMSSRGTTTRARTTE